MTKVSVTRDEFLEDRQGKTFADIVTDPEQPFDAVLDFFDDADRQRRMEESELHHDRSPLAGVVRELESQAAVDEFLSGVHAKRSRRLRQGHWRIGTHDYESSRLAEDRPKGIARRAGQTIGHTVSVPQQRGLGVLVRPCRKI